MQLKRKKSIYLALPGLGRPAPHEALVDHSQVLLPVLHLEAGHMAAPGGRRTHVRPPHINPPAPPARLLLKDLGAGGGKAERKKGEGKKKAGGAGWRGESRGRGEGGD